MLWRCSPGVLLATGAPSHKATQPAAVLAGQGCCSIQAVLLLSTAPAHAVLSRAVRTARPVGAAGQRLLGSTDPS